MLALLYLQCSDWDLYIFSVCREYFEDVDRTWETFDKKLWGHIYDFFKLAKERYHIDSLVYCF